MVRTQRWGYGAASSAHMSTTVHGSSVEQGLYSADSFDMSLSRIECAQEDMRTGCIGADLDLCTNASMHRAALEPVAT